MLFPTKRDLYTLKYNGVEVYGAIAVPMSICLAKRKELTSSGLYYYKNFEIVKA